MKDEEFIPVPYFCPINLTYSEPVITVERPADRIRNKPYTAGGSPADLSAAVDQLGDDMAKMTRKTLEDSDKLVMTAVQDIGIHIEKDELVKVLQGDRTRYEEAYRCGVRSGKRMMTVVEKFFAEHKHGYIAAEDPVWCMNCPLSADARREAQCLMADREPNSTSMRVPGYCPITTLPELMAAAEKEAEDAEGRREATRDADENHRADALRYLTMTGGDQE